MTIPRFRIYSRPSDNHEWEWVDSRQDRGAAFRLFDQYKSDCPAAEYQLVDGTTNETLIRSTRVVRPTLLLLEQDGEWGLSTAGPNPPPEEYVSVASKQVALDIIAAYERGDIQPFLRAAGCFGASS